jgi:hypothetical protein
MTALPRDDYGSVAYFRNYLLERLVATTNERAKNMRNMKHNDNKNTKWTGIRIR